MYILNAKEITHTDHPELNNKVEELNKFYGFNKLVVQERIEYKKSWLLFTTPVVVFEVYIRPEKDSEFAQQPVLYSKSLNGTLNYLEGLLHAYELF